MKYAVILETGSVTDSIRPIAKVFDANELKEKHDYILKMTSLGHRCHIFEYKETKHLQSSIITSKLEGTNL